jgi:hypothetical protein
MLPLFFLIAICLMFFRLQLFFPLMAIAALRLTRLQALWIAAAAGFYLDLVASDHYLGFRAVLFVLIMSLLYPYKRLVFEEKCLPFSLYSALFGILYTLSLSLIQTIGPPHFVWSIEFVLIDLLLLPLCDSLIGWILFIAPQTVIRFFKRYLVRFKHDE